jgi:hypothetical protein
MANVDIGVPQLDKTFRNLQYNNAFNPQEDTMLNNIKKTTRLHKKLLDAGDRGFEKFQKLDTNVQTMLKAFYGEETEYMIEPESGFGAIVEGVKNFATSPFRALFGALEDYSQGINAIQNQFLQWHENGKDFFDKDVWATSLFEGETLYNTELDNQYTQKYGKAKAFIAKMALAGRKPGEIVQAYGKLDDEFVAAMESFLNDPEEWDSKILEDYRQAKLSVGRSIARFFLGSRNGQEEVQDGFIYDLAHAVGFDNFSMDAETRDKLFTYQSGVPDLTYQILADPLTYLTFGASTGFKFGGKAISQLAKANEFAKVGNIDGLFQLKKVRKFWDGYGAKIDLLTKARAAGEFGYAEKIVQEIKFDFARHGTDADIEYFVNLQKNRKDPLTADDIHAHFKEIGNFTMLMSGRTSDASYYMDSVAIAKRSRVVGNVFRQIWYRLNTVSDNIGDLQSTTKQIQDELLQLGDETATSKVQTPTLWRLSQKNKDFRGRIANLLAKHPSDESIIIGENAAETLQTVRNIATILVGPEAAGVIAQRFLAADMNQRVVMLRGMYRGIGYLFGLDKTTGGIAIMDEMLNAKFGNIGMKTQRNLEVPTHIKDAGISKLPEGTTDIDGSLYDVTTTDIIGNINWEIIRQATADAAFMTGGRTKSKTGRVSVIQTVGGAVNGTLASKVVDTWSLLTLAPKLGIRSSIDEMFFFALSAPRQVFLNYLTQKGKAGGRAITRYTGSSRAQGPIANVLRKAVGKVFKFKGLDPAQDISLIRRETLLDAARAEAAALKLPESAIPKIFQKLLAHESVSYSPVLKGENAEWMEQLLIHNPGLIDSAASSVSRRTGLSAQPEDPVAVAFHDSTMLTKVREELEIKLGKNYNELNPANLTNHELKTIMYNEMFTRFFKNKIGEYLDLGPLFIKYRGLDTADDYAGFVNEIVRTILSNKALTENFLSRRAGVVSLRKSGLSDEEIVTRYAEAMASDMYILFHGDKGQFNVNLVAYFQNHPKNFYKALDELDLEKYSDLVDGNLRKTPIATNIESMKDMDGAISNFNGSMASWWKLAGEKVWDWMDRTATAIVRQPVVTSYYLHYRKMYQYQEAEFFTTTLDNLIFDWAARSMRSVDNVPPKVLDILAERAQRLTDKFFAEQASKAAVNHTLKYVDNPHVRSMLVSSVRNINRFARATEDFWRRIYRLKDVSAQAIYRARLMHTGLNGVGSVERDQNGNEYFMLPMDDVLYAALDPVLKTLGGDDASFKQPMFNNFTVSLTALNPSFQDQAGIPFLSGPIAGLGVWSFKAIAGRFGGEPGELLADEADNLLLGDIGDNIDLRRAVTPALVDRLWKMLDSDEKAQHNHGAILSAIAYNEAHGRGLSPNATAAEQQEYLENIRVSAHNLVTIRSLLGTILPFSVGSQEDVDLPDYIRDSGLTSIRSEYFDILDAVIDKYGADVSDPFELAAAIFVGENPKKLVYTVSREDKKVKPLLRKTDAVRKWILGNKGFIDRYGEAAYFFAPQIGDLNIAMYNWMEAAGLAESIDVREYLQDVQVAVDKQKYFAISDWEDEQLANMGYADQRRAIINQATQMREALKMSNPLLRAEIEGSGFDTIYEEEMLNLVKEVVKDKRAPLTPEQRKRVNLVLNIFNRGYEYVRNENLKNISSYAELKRGMKYRIFDELEEITAGDPLTSQMFRLIFKPLLNYYARDAASAAREPEYQSIGSLG